MRYHLYRSGWLRRRSFAGDAEGMQALLGIGAFVLFVVSTWLSFREFRYLLFSRRTEGTILRQYIESTPTGKGGQKRVRVVEYAFDDNGNSRTEKDRLPLRIHVPESGKVSVDYFPGRRFGSRLSNHRELWAVAVFFLSMAACGAALAVAWRESADVADEPKPRRKVRRAKPRPTEWKRID